NGILAVQTAAAGTVAGEIPASGVNVLFRNRKRIPFVPAAHRHVAFDHPGQGCLPCAGSASSTAHERQRKEQHRCNLEHVYSTTTTMFMLPWLVPQKWSQMIGYVPAFCGVKVTSVDFPGSMS